MVCNILDNCLNATQPFLFDIKLGFQFIEMIDKDCNYVENFNVEITLTTIYMDLHPTQMKEEKVGGWTHLDH